MPHTVFIRIQKVGQTMEYIHAKRKGNKSFQNDNNRNLEVVFKWVPVKGVRLSVPENKAVYEEYKAVRSRLLKDTVYNPDGTPNEEGISRLRQAGLDDNAIAIVGKGRTPNGYNYHHLFPRAISGSFKDGGVQFGDEKLTSIHDWRCMLPLSNARGRDIHSNVHSAMEERNGPLPEKAGTKLTYYIAMPLSAKEYEMYKQNPKSVNAELLIVGTNSYRTVDQRTSGDKTISALDIAKLKRANGR